MSIGFVYILLNPAFPQYIKIGLTARDTQRRASELSRQTGVPNDFIIIYDAIVSDAEQVESLLHDRFNAYRVSRNKGFFQIPPKDAIDALQEIARRFPIPSSTLVLKADLLPHFTKYFSEYLDSKVVAIELVQLPALCYLEVTRQSGKDSPPITTQEEVPLYGLVTPDVPTIEDLQANEVLLRGCDAYDWIMISDLFSSETVQKIATEWEKPNGKLEQKRNAV